MLKDNPPIHIEFEYKNKKYPIDILEGISFVHEDPYIKGVYSWFWWEEGNGSCDCNRSVEIQEYYPDFPELDCGHEIKIINKKILTEN